MVSTLVRYLDKNSWIVLIVIFLTRAATQVHNVVCGNYSDHVAVVTHKFGLKKTKTNYFD